nr:hypothetical protein [Acidimicrobiia bacterium]
AGEAAALERALDRARTGLAEAEAAASSAREAEEAARQRVEELRAS